MMSAKSPTSAPNKETSKDKKSMDRNTPKKTIEPKKTTDNSNPQQGTGNYNKSHKSSGTTEKASKGGDQSKERLPPNKKDSRKLFVGGLPMNVTEEEFRECFEQYGTLVDSVVMFDRDTHRSRGFGFVTFEDPAVCNSLLNTIENGKHVGRVTMSGKVCELKPAEPREWAPPAARHRNRNKHSASNRKPSAHSQRSMTPITIPPNVIPAEYAPGAVPPPGVAPWPYSDYAQPIPITDVPVPGMVLPEGYYPGMPAVPLEVPYEYPGTAMPPVGVVPSVPATVSPVPFNPYVGYPPQYPVPPPQDVIPGPVPYSQVVMGAPQINPTEVGPPTQNGASHHDGDKLQQEAGPDVSGEGKETGQP